MMYHPDYDAVSAFQTQYATIQRARTADPDKPRRQNELQAKQQIVISLFSELINQWLSWKYPKEWVQYFDYTDASNMLAMLPDKATFADIEARLLFTKSMTKWGNETHKTIVFAFRKESPTERA